MLRRMDKSFYAVRYSYVRLLLVSAAAAGVLAGPVVGAFAAGWTPVRILAGASYALLAVAGVLVSRKLAWPARTGPLLPLGFGVITFGLLRAGLNCWRRGGLRWRGTFYPVDQLRAAQQKRGHSTSSGLRSAPAPDWFKPEVALKK